MESAHPIGVFLANGFRYYWGGFLWWMLLGGSVGWISLCVKTYGSYVPSGSEMRYAHTPNNILKHDPSDCRA